MLKPNTNGSQTAVLTMNRAAATRLVSKCRVILGWENCRVRFKVNVGRCYKFLQYGHRIDKCKSQDKRDVCVRCGNKGQKTKEFKWKIYCMECNVGNHRADSMRCPRFRELVTKMNHRMLRRVEG